MVDKRYQEYTSSKLIWVKDYPAHWNLTRVKYEAYVKARVGWHGLTSNDFTDVGPYLVTGSDFKGSTIKWEDCYHCDLKRYEQDPYIQLKNGDLLLTKDGTIGKVALVDGLKHDDKATLNSGVFVVRPLSNNFTTRFYYWLLESRVFKDFVDYYASGSTIIHLYQATFVNFSYASPPIYEQEKIASFLDHETAKIDTLIEKQQRLIELLTEKRQAVISHAVTKGLNPNVPMKDSGVEWLGEVPAHWELPKLIQQTSRIGDGLHSTPKYQDNTGYYFVNGNNLVNGQIVIGVSAKEVPEDEYIKHFIPLDETSVLLSINGTIGNVARYKGEKVILGKSASYMNCSNQLTPEYLILYLQSSQVRHYFDLEVTGTTIYNLSLNSLRQMKVCIPPKSEQLDIDGYCNAQKDKYDFLIEKANLQIQLMQERRTALISAAVTGKIDVRNWVKPE